MYIFDRLLLTSFFIASIGFALPIEPSDLDVRSPTPITEASNLEVTTLDSSNAVVESRSVLAVPDHAKTRKTRDLRGRGDINGGKYAPSSETRKKELKNTKNNLSPDGLNGPQEAKKLKKPYDEKEHDSGATVALEYVKGGELGDKCGPGCKASLYSKGSKESQQRKASKASKGGS